MFVPLADRGGFQIELMEALEQDEAAAAEFLKLRRLFKQVSRLDAEDNLISLVKSGKAQNVKAMNAAMFDLKLAENDAIADDDDDLGKALSNFDAD